MFAWGPAQISAHVSVIGASGLAAVFADVSSPGADDNLLYDFSQVPIPTDNVGPQQTAKPRPWQIGEIAKFIVFIGPISSIFDYRPTRSCGSCLSAIMWGSRRTWSRVMAPMPRIILTRRRCSTLVGC